MENATVETRHNWCRIATVTLLAILAISVLYYITFLGFTRDTFDHWDIEIITCSVILILIIIIVTALMSVNNAELISKKNFFLAIWISFSFMAIPIIALLFTGYQKYAIWAAAAAGLFALIDVLITDPSNCVAPSHEEPVDDYQILNIDIEQFVVVHHCVMERALGERLEHFHYYYFATSSESSSSTQSPISEELIVVDLYQSLENRALGGSEELFPDIGINIPSETNSSSQLHIREEQIVDVYQNVEERGGEMMEPSPPIGISISSEMSSSSQLHIHEEQIVDVHQNHDGKVEP